MLKSKKIYLANAISGLEGVVVTGASEKGTGVRLFHTPVEGKPIRGNLLGSFGGHDDIMF